jgi:NADH-quinone oxidoreductase subunit H
MSDWGNALLALLVWPGLLSGLLLGWFDLWLLRKLVARLQGRQGPPFYQPFFDFVKLLGKRTLLPGGVSPLLFYGLPLLALVSVAAALALLPVPGSPLTSFSGDLVLLLYLLEMPALVDILAGFVTRSIYAQVGSAREALLTLGYNLPFITALVALALQRGSFGLRAIAGGALSPVTFLAGLALLAAIPARLKTNPFSIPNAEQEIVAGTHTEFNGLPLALFELTHALEVAALAGLFAALFVGGVANPWLGTLLYLLLSTGVVALTCLLAAATARMKIQHAFRFFWTWGAAAAALALAAALIW